MTLYRNAVRCRMDPINRNWLLPRGKKIWKSMRIYCCTEMLLAAMQIHGTWSFDVTGGCDRRRTLLINSFSWMIIDNWDEIDAKSKKIKGTWAWLSHFNTPLCSQRIPYIQLNPSKNGTFRLNAMLLVLSSIWTFHLRGVRHWLLKSDRVDEFQDAQGWTQTRFSGVLQHPVQRWLKELPVNGNAEVAIISFDKSTWIKTASRGNL